MSKVIGFYFSEVTQAVERFDSGAMEFVCEDETYSIRIEIVEKDDKTLMVCDALGGLASYDNLEELLEDTGVRNSEITWLKNNYLSS